MGFDYYLGRGRRSDNNLLQYYGGNHTTTILATFTSFKISRPLQGREQLDFSREVGADWCGKFLRSYWPQDSLGMEYFEGKDFKANITSGMH